MFELTSYGNTYNVILHKETYQNGGLALRLDYFDEDMQGWLPYVNLTVNLGRLNHGYAYVDINNFPEAEEFIEKNHLGVPTGKICCSGFCFYPLYQFDLSKIS